MAAVARSDSSPLGPLHPDPNRVMDLPAEFSYRIVSRAGDRMDDGLRVPNAHDGMAAFAGDNGRIILVCNHELEISELQLSAFVEGADAISETVRDKLYDAGRGITPGTSGTTTTIYNPATGKTERQRSAQAFHNVTPIRHLVS